jgi:ribosomal protein L32
VPARKKTKSRTKGRFQGWYACAAAVRTAAKMPEGVRDCRECARYTMAAVAGTA